jgi:hypothetical protein
MEAEIALAYRILGEERAADEEPDYDQSADYDRLYEERAEEHYQLAAEPEDEPGELDDLDDDRLGEQDELDDEEDDLDDGEGEDDLDDEEDEPAPRYQRGKISGGPLDPIIDFTGTVAA